MRNIRDHLYDFFTVDEEDSAADRIGAVIMGLLWLIEIWATS